MPSSRVPPPRFGHFHSLNWWREVAPGCHSVPEFAEVDRQVFLRLSDRLTIHSSTAVVCFGALIYLRPQLWKYRMVLPCLTESLQLGIVSENRSKFRYVCHFSSDGNVSPSITVLFFHDKSVMAVKICCHSKGEIRLRLSRRHCCKYLVVVIRLLSFADGAAHEPIQN